MLGLVHAHSIKMRSLLAFIFLFTLCVAHAPRTLDDKYKARLRHARSKCPGAHVHCILAREAMEGPFYVIHPLVRSNITEDREGIPLEVTVSLVNVSNCAPLPSLFVDIWHADAMGEYSGWASTHLDASLGLQERGIPVEDSRWLRGVQETDENGVAKFSTILPGWYQGRCTHIHVRVHAGNVTLEDGVLLGDGQTAHTGQIFFDDKLVLEASKTREPYITHRQQHAPMLNEEDGIYLDSDGAEQTISVKRVANALHGFITIGIDPEADHDEPSFPGRPPHRGHRRPGRHSKSHHCAFFSFPRLSIWQKYSAVVAFVAGLGLIVHLRLARRRRRVAYEQLATDKAESS